MNRMTRASYGNDSVTMTREPLTVTHPTTVLLLLGSDGEGMVWATGVDKMSATAHTADARSLLLRPACSG